MTKRWKLKARLKTPRAARARLATKSPKKPTACSTHGFRHGIEHAVDELRLLVVEEGVGDVDVLADRGLGRHVGPSKQLVSPRAQDLQQGLVEALEPPVRRQPLGE